MEKWKKVIKRKFILREGRKKRQKVIIKKEISMY